MKKVFSLLLANLVFSMAAGQETEILYLSGKDKDHTVMWDFLCTNGRNSNAWSKIGVPSNWELQGFGSYKYGNINPDADEKGLYKYEFTVPVKWKSKQVYIVFEGSMTDTRVFINGKLAGPDHQGAFYRFRYDISDLLNYGGLNILGVTVSKESANESVNRAERISDYWVFGGIYRPVRLEAMPVQNIDRVAIDARADGTFRMDVFTVGNPKGAKVTARLETPGGNPLGELISKPADPSGKTLLEGKFSDPDLWNPEFPNLYKVSVTLTSGKKVIHRINEKFGFRTVEVRDGDGIYVNGRKIILKGVCRHTFWPSSGRTSSKKLAIEDVGLMKDMNMNAVRMSHYPPDSYFLDVCDSMGMFVLDELAGWQKFYDTPTAKRLVRQMVERDVNHPCIILWDNGNEGGFNKEVRDDYALYDPQKRRVIEPWSTLNGINTKHYPGYKYVENALTNGKEIYFPTEFLHGLYDGGHGAGLNDYWELMTSEPLSAGGFLWVFADEGVERKDLNDSIDAEGNRGPDGILGPYHEKEGSFYTIREIWSPVQPEDVSFNENFEGKIKIANTFIYTNLEKCSFKFGLIRYSGNFPYTGSETYDGIVSSPDIPAGGTGDLVLDLPAGWRNWDILELSVFDPAGRLLNIWSWNITKPEEFAARVVKTTDAGVSASVSDSLLTVRSEKTEITFDERTGMITAVKYSGNKISFDNGMRFAGFNPDFKGIEHFRRGDDYTVKLKYENGCEGVWTILRGGWLKLDFKYNLEGSFDYAGITFSYPENLVTGAVLLANGPYHVWKNRLKGTRFGLYDKKYNNTITGESWEYPEFKGYYSEFNAVQISTTEQPITIVSATEGLYLHLFTPGKAQFSERGVSGNVNPPFPDGNISILHGISPIGTKFSKAETEGPQGEKNRFATFASGQPLSGTLYFRFGE